MPLVSIQAGKVDPSAPAGVGTQSVAGLLTLTNPTYVEFDPEIFGAAANVSTGYKTFTVFTFGSVSPAYDPLAEPPTDPAKLLRVDAFSLAALGYGYYEFKTVGNSITVTFS